eukprot:g19.t1
MMRLVALTFFGIAALTSPVHGVAVDVKPVHDMLTRVIGAEAASQFELHVDPEMAQGFNATTPDTDTDADTNATRIVVAASGLPELAYGCGYYLRTQAHMSFAWQRAGGNQVQIPEGGLPHLKAPLTLRKKARWTYYQNVCTQSYSMWWWDWPRWQQELDWAALWGVNLVLAYTGQEDVFRRVYNELGVSDEILNTTFDGPAFLTWSRGQGTFAFGGPLPDSWIRSQHALQGQIMTRLRELGMRGILPAFQGNVPMQLPQIFPTANSSNGWLDGLDPLFTRIARSFGSKLALDFGQTGFVEADGWFSLETGPWLSSDAARVRQWQQGQQSGAEAKWHVPMVGMLHETDLGAADSSAAAASAGTIADLDTAAGEMSAGADTDTTQCLRNFRIPSEEEAYTRARAVFTSITAADPDATWVYQGYPWFRVYSQGAACNQTRLRQFIRGFTRAIPKDRLLVLDLVADSPGRALWRYPADPVLGEFAQNASLIWCALNNWGGAVHMGGDIENALSEVRAAVSSQNLHVTGVGLTPEGIDNSPAYFSLVLDAPWTPQPTAAAWLQEWAAGRCGRAGVAAAEAAWALLAQTVYRPGKPYLWCCSQPKFCPTVLPGDKGVARPDYNVTLLRQALELMVTAAPKCNTSSFRYDLVDVAREWLSMAPCLDAFDAVPSAGAPATQLKESVDALRDVYADIDRILGAEPGFLLGSWLKASRAVSSWDGSTGELSARLADFYEWNSRVQITTWAGAYSRREWAGMISTYYDTRASIWLNYTLHSASADMTVSPSPSSSSASSPLHDASPGALNLPGFVTVPQHDCNFDDLSRSPASSESALATVCNNTAGCVAFNWPGRYLKKGCHKFKAVPPTVNSTLYIRAEALPRSSCIGGICSSRIGGNGTFIGTDCGGSCPSPAPVVPLSTLLSQFDTVWQNTTWTEQTIPSQPMGDAVAIVKALLAKYKNIN